MSIHNTGSGFMRRASLSVLVAMGALGATVALTSNAPPVVSSGGQPRIVKVQYGDLNLSTPRGKKALSQRIRLAADLVCNQPEPRALQVWSEYRKCMQNATDSAWSQIHWPDAPIMEAAGTAPRKP